jgi:hypothetical protein
MNANGAGPQNLTQFLRRPLPGLVRRWAIDRLTSQPGREPEIYVIRLDGSGLTNLTNNPAEDFFIRPG